MALGLGATVFLGAPLRAVSPAANGAEMGEVRVLWTWLKAHRKPDVGRTYIQDTFYTRPLDSGLAQSHVLALTAHEAGISQVGPYYGVAPYGTQPWLRSEFGRVFNRGVGSTEDAGDVVAAMDRFACGRLVLSDPALRAFFDDLPGLSLEFRSQRFTVYRRLGVPPSLIDSSGTVSARLVSVDPGVIRVLGTSAQADGEFGLKEAWHPFWKLDAPAGVVLAADDAALIRVRHVPSGRFEWTLRYDPPRWPLLVTVVGWLAIAAAAWMGRELGSAASA